MKSAFNSAGTFDEDGFRRRAACLCVRSDREDEILLISSKRSFERWIVPGGGIEPLEEPTTAAVRELLEEAGVRGCLKRCLGVLENSERRHRTFVYVLVVNEELSQWDEQARYGRKRRWFNLDEARSLVKPAHRAYFDLL